MIEGSNLKPKIIHDQLAIDLKVSEFTEKLLIKILKVNILEKIKNSPKLTKLNKIKG